MNIIKKSYKAARAVVVLGVNAVGEAFDSITEVTIHLWFMVLAAYAAGICLANSWWVGVAFFVLVGAFSHHIVARRFGELEDRVLTYRGRYLFERTQVIVLQQKLSSERLAKR